MATDVVIVGAIADIAGTSTPKEAICAVAVGVFDAIDAHPSIGAQLARAPRQRAMLDLFERIGRALQALAVPAAKQFTAASALVSYILGVGGQNAANARMAEPGMSRATFLVTCAKAWAAIDAKEYAFTRAMANQLRDHDDREEFLAGIDLIVAGVTAR